MDPLHRSVEHPQARPATWNVRARRRARTLREVAAELDDLARRRAAVTLDHEHDRPDDTFPGTVA
jgi:hypothetical protein